MDELKKEPCKIYAQKVQDCLTENKFDIPKCYSLMNKLEACCQIINYLKTSNFYTSSTVVPVVAYTFKPAFNGGIPRDLAAELGLDINMINPPMSREKFEALKANLRKLKMDRYFDRHVERVAIKNQGVYCWKVQVRPNGKTIHYAEDKNMREENKKHVHVGHDGPIIPPTEDLEVMKNLREENKKQVHVGHDGPIIPPTEDLEVMKNLREENKKQVHVGHDGPIIPPTEDLEVMKNLREENKKQVHVGHDGPIIPPTEDLEVMKNLCVVDFGPSFNNRGVFLSKFHVGHDGITKLYVNDKSMIKKMREEEYMNKGVFCSRAWYCLDGISTLSFRERTAVDMPSDK